MTGPAPLFLLSGDAPVPDLASLAAQLPDIAGLFVDGQDDRHIDLRYMGLSFVLSRAGAEALDDYHPVLCDRGGLTPWLDLDLGPHVEGGLALEPVRRAFLSLARRIGEMAGAMAIGWRPAGLLVGMDYFVRSISDHENGGPFPALSLVRYVRQGDYMRSHGLGWLCGQEIAYRSGNLSSSALVKRMVRLAHDMVTHGPILQPTEIEGLDEGEHIRLWPEQADGQMILFGESRM